ITDERSRRAVGVAARYADNVATEEELLAARTAAQEAKDEAAEAAYVAEAEANFCITPSYAAACCRSAAAGAARSAVNQNPRLALAIYEEQAFERLPILADALEEAGCTDADILSHLRRPGTHARGCYVLDLLLGRR